MVVGPDEAEAAALQVLAQRLRLGGRRRELGEACGAAHDRRAVDERPTRTRRSCRAPAAPSRTACALAIVDSIFAAVADDRRVAEQSLDVAFGEARDLLRIEAARTRRGSPHACAGSCVQREPGLRALEREQLEERGVVVRRDAPLVVVVRDHERVGARPLAARRSAAGGAHSSVAEVEVVARRASGRAGPGTSIPSRSLPYGCSAAVVMRRNEIWPIFMPG